MIPKIVFSNCTFANNVLVTVFWRQDLIGPKIWEQLPPEVQTYILVLEETLRQSLARIAQLEQRVNDLEARLNRNSSNSSQPPSQDPPQTPKKTKGEKSGRSPGGQPGHQGNHRERLPADKLDKIV
jgi:transposase